MLTAPRTLELPFPRWLILASSDVVSLSITYGLRFYIGVCLNTTPDRTESLLQTPTRTVLLLQCIQLKAQPRLDAFESPQAIPMMIRTADHPIAISL